MPCNTPCLFLSTGGLVAINTANPNAQLDVDGTISATNFVGDGSGLTGVVAGATDRIISGTNQHTRMVAISDTGFISVTQSAVNTGWFDPARGFVTGRRPASPSGEARYIFGQRKGLDEWARGCR